MSRPRISIFSVVYLFVYRVNSNNKIISDYEAVAEHGILFPHLGPKLQKNDLDSDEFREYEKYDEKLEFFLQ